ncbi:MAG: DUF924 family protein [Pseudobdellovibrionaceae bacterium]
MNPNEVLSFWFEELKPGQWFQKNLELDQIIRQRFQDVHLKASQSELFSWRETIQGRLAEVLVLDQFSRNMFRDDAKAFAQDPLALALAQEAIRTGLHFSKLSQQQRSFLYMPFMHSEALSIHELAVGLFSEQGLESGLDFEMRHKVIIERFGRFPHRNEILGRISTNEEIEFLKQPGSRF